jgi:hypothetical protein
MSIGKRLGGGAQLSLNAWANIDLGKEEQIKRQKLKSKNEEWCGCGADRRLALAAFSFLLFFFCFLIFPDPSLRQPLYPRASPLKPLRQIN